MTADRDPSSGEVSGREVHHWGPAGRSDSDVVVHSVIEPQLFGEIYQRHVDDIHRYLARRIGRSLADDLASETFLAAFRGRERYDPIAGQVRPWLFGIANNLLRRHWRRERAQYRSWERLGVDPVATDGHDQTVADQVTAASQARRMAGALSRIPAKERDVLLHSGTDFCEVGVDEVCPEVSKAEFRDGEEIAAAPYLTLVELPTDPDELLQVVEAEADRLDDSPWGVMSRLAMSLPAPQRAALFRAAATMPDLQRYDDLTDVLGRPGVGVGQYRPGLQGIKVVIFDPETYEYLGSRVLHEDGSISFDMALVRSGVVDAVGDVPAQE